MRNTILVTTLLLSFLNVFAQDKEKHSHQPFTIQTNLPIEDQNGQIITDPIARENYFKEKQARLDLLEKQRLIASTLVPVQMCSNGGFEEFSAIGGNYFLNDFQFISTNVFNPVQCKDAIVTANQDIAQYDPSGGTYMASTVPASFNDQFIGNIAAFDQFALKINHINSSTELAVVQGKRFKTNNERFLKFNYKVVLQSIDGSGHDNEQPYFKARILNNSGAVVNEFCLIADVNNCIFTVAPSLAGGSKVLYTANWQTGVLDISSIPNNENFTVEFMAHRCGLGGHFGYAYIDDICYPHSNESLQGSIDLDPLYKICPTMPIQVCGSFTLPNSGGVSATVTSIELKVFNSSNTVVYTTTTTSSLDLTTKRFCFDLAAANLPNLTTGAYNVSVTINYGIVSTTCSGTNFASANDDDANPGWDIWFLNCDPTCNFQLNTTNLALCDTDRNGKEFFNLTNADALITTTTGLTFKYYTTVGDATNDTNAITTFLNYESYSTTIFVRANQSPTCFKIIAIQLVVRNPAASISGILNICNGPTTLTASNGASYVWSTGALTQSISVNALGTYSVIVIDSNGCSATKAVTIQPNLVAVSPTIVVTQPTCFVSTGTINITSPASDYSFDGGATWSTNPILNNVSVGTYQIKIKTVAGCISYNSSIDIIPFQMPFPNFTKVDPTTCGDTGTITITTLSPFYSFDDGLTWTTNNIATNLPIDTYLIRIKDAAGCISNFNSVVLFDEFLAPPTYTIDPPFCGNTGSITITTPSSQYSFDGGVTWQTSNTKFGFTSGSYIIKIKNAQGCTSPTVYVFITDFENTTPQYTITPAGCGIYNTITIDSVGDYFSFDNGATWSTNPVLTGLNGGTSYDLMTRKGLTCTSNSTSVFLNLYYLPIPTASDYATIICDNLNDGSEIIDLTTYNGNLISNPSNFTFEYYKTQLDATNAVAANRILNFTSYNMDNVNNEVFVRVISINLCFKVVKLKIIYIPSPYIDMKTSFPLCENKFIFVNTGGVYDSFTWSTGATTPTIRITQPGNYWVTVTKNHPTLGLICSSTKNFTVFLSNPAVITSIDTEDWTDTENIISVNISGSSIGNYQYSIDGINYQTSNQFFGLESGIYKVFVKDLNDCGIVDKTVFLLMYPRFFTPNNDGINDLWGIKFSKYEKGLTTQLFDKYGNFIAELNYNQVWDGKVNGVPVLSDDYWFVVTRADGAIHKGHFAIKR